MGPKIQVTPDGLDQPSYRFSVLGNDIGQLDNEIGTQCDTAKSAAGGDTHVSGGLDVFRNGMSGALQALDSDACLLGGNIAQAKITYQVTDKCAYHLSTLTDVPKTPLPPTKPAQKPAPEQPHPTPGPPIRTPR